MYVIATKKELIEAFKLWHEDNIEKPDEFIRPEDAESSESFAEGCAEGLSDYLNKVRAK